MKRLYTAEDSPKLTTNNFIWIAVLSTGVMCALGGFFLTGYVTGYNGSQQAYSISVNNLPSGYILNPGVSLTFDDEYTNDSEIKRTQNEYHPSVGDASSFLVSRSVSETLITFFNIFHYDTSLGFFPLRSPPLLS